jgi:hypothetical protein
VTIVIDTRRKLFSESLVPTDANMNIKKSRLSAKKKKRTMLTTTMMLKTTKLTTTMMLQTTKLALESESHS